MANNPAPFFICVTGLPGSGKSYFAIHLAQSIGAHHINSDRLRSRLGLRGHYDQESKRLVYKQLLREAEADLQKGHTVVLDSTFYRQQVRQPLEDLSKSLGIPIFWIEIKASEAVIRERINKQRPYSQADFSVYQSIKEKYEPLPHIDLVLHSDRNNLDEMLSSAQTALGMMTSDSIQTILQKKAFPDTADNGKVIETHASWVILSDHFAFKIKKPVHYSFMDFSSPEKRKYYCERELELNRRLAEDIYLAVLPIRKTTSGLRIGATEGPVFDHCVQLKRMEESLRMDLLLQHDQVKPESLDRIAEQLAEFHQRTETIWRKWDLAQAQMDFYDLKKVRPVLQKAIGRKAAELLDRILLLGNQFLKRHMARFQARLDDGFLKDGHGDLHSGNIFLYPQPILFDCIEFNDHLRQVDPIDELAFLSMDLEFHNRPELAERLVNTYRSRYEVFPDEEDQLLFQYYKTYRANVRLKVTALKEMDNPAEEDVRIMQRYLVLLEKYAQDLLA